jgi:hypothetical protein
VLETVVGDAYRVFGEGRAQAIPQSHAPRYPGERVKLEDEEVDGIAERGEKRGHVGQDGEQRNDDTPSRRLTVEVGEDVGYPKEDEGEEQDIDVEARDAQADPRSTAGNEGSGVAPTLAVGSAIASLPGLQFPADPAAPATEARRSLFPRSRGVPSGAR